MVVLFYTDKLINLSYYNFIATINNALLNINHGNYDNKELI